MPKLQGDLDGMCGLYAIANAFETCGISRKALDCVFEASCNSIPQSRWPATIWEGTEIGDLQRMIKACRENIAGLSHITVTYPFQRTAPKTNDEYWRAFDALFEQRGAVCCIVGVVKPRYHWLVASRKSQDRLAIVDSNRRGYPFLVKRSSIFAGYRGHPNYNRVFERNQIILFCKRPNVRPIIRSV